MDNQSNRPLEEVNDSYSKACWVKNISSKNLTVDQISLLSIGAGYAIIPKEVPIDEYIIATESACKHVPAGVASVIRAEVVEILEKADKPKSNLSRKQMIALKELKNDQSIIVVPADKGKCMVVIDKVEYIQKLEEKLSDITTYKKIGDDPTFRIKEKLSELLKAVHEKGEINSATYRKLLPTKTQIPRLYGQPKIHKEGFPMREIVDSSGSVTKDVNKHISTIIKPLVGNTEYFVKNSSHFKDSVKDLRVEEEETLVSYDVKALYPSDPQEEAIELIERKLHEDEMLINRTKMSIKSIIDLLKLCVQNTYFVINKILYSQIQGLAMGASTFGFTAEILMENLEIRAINSFINPLSK